MSNVVLVGFMGSGKTKVGRALAERLGRPFIDLDGVIETEAGRSINHIFAEEQEAGFRAYESRCLRRVLADDSQVVAVGGGAPLDQANWQAIRTGNWVVALTAPPEELQARLRDATDRPLLRDGVKNAIESLLPPRMGRYREADLILPTDGRSPEAVAAAIADALPHDGVERIAVNVHGFPHEIVVGAGLRHLLSGVLTRGSVQGSVALITDSVVGPRHATALEQALRSNGWHTHRFEVPAGEGAKSLETMNAVYQFLAGAGIDRSGAVIALGGGVVGDVAGFTAATWMRGIPYVQVPTTLLAMVDSSIGGKTGINLAAGKNLVGAVHQPAAIICDLDYLKTLPDAEYRAAWGEIIKCAVAGDRELFDQLKAVRPAALGRDESVVRGIVARAAAFKARVVAEDPYDRNLRAVLNYGHTVAHAMEAALGYGAIRHGEAVAWGMRVAGRLSVDTGHCSPATAQAQDSLLRDYSLLAETPPALVSQLMRTIQRDKKAQDGEPRWVLLRDIGQAEYGRRMPREKVEAALMAVLAP